ncbi:MAG: hemagglutinin repeat-containing protein, partial [Serratia liquefaciens]|nr:hemagglutinin repeat-containing protein [Serratia liquefaciens]
HTTKTDVGVDIGANVDYSAVTRPVERAIRKIAKLDANGVIHEIGDIGAPNLGLDIGANGGSNKKSSSSSQAVANNITAGAIDVKATGKLQDNGTKYQATQGSVALTADSHHSEAAKNSRQESSSETRGGANVRVYTTTGSDLTVDAQGEGGNKHSESTGSQAMTGSITAANGINIKVKQDAVYQGTSLDAGNGKAKVKTEDGNIRFEQATDSSHESHNGFDVKVSAKGGTTPETKSFGVGLGGGYDRGKSDGSSAQVSHIGGKQGVELDAGRGLTLQGSQVASQNDVRLKAGDKVALQAAQSHQTRKNNTLSGNIDIGTDIDKKSTGDISLNHAFDITWEDASSTPQQGGKITSDGAVNITAKGDDDRAVHLQGTEIKGSSVGLNAEHGGVVLESIQNKEQKNSWNLGLKANAKGGQSVNKDASGKIDATSDSDAHTLGAGVKVGVDNLQKTTQNNSLISAGEVTINSSKDTQLAGARIDADRVQG